MRTLLAVSFCLGCLVTSSQAQFAVQQQVDRLVITNESGRSIVEYVFSDPEIRRPYFTRAHSPSGKLLTRQYPPVPGVDAVDHSTMHPGIWLAFGDISGQDFWRNKATLKHQRFVEMPTVVEETLRFATSCEMVSADSSVIGQIENQYQIVAKSSAWIVVWRARLKAIGDELTLGDQEEMGFGARMATPLTEKNSGRIVNAEGLSTAKDTWGRAAAWCDYSGKIDGQSCGITLIASPHNFRPSHWHNRDYGLFVANPFAIAAMKQGPASQVVVPIDKPLTLAFAAVLHDSDEYQPQKIYTEVVDSDWLKWK